MAAIVYNLKKYVGFISRKGLSASATLEIKQQINKTDLVFNIYQIRRSLAILAR